jgi:hypothetical protein
MGKRHPNPRLVKIHRSYTVDEIASLLKAHKNTVRNWLKSGLPTIDSRRPALIYGPELVKFLQGRRARSKHTCQPGQIFCVRCRVPRTPAANMADYQPVTATTGNLVGICSTCESMMYRRVNFAKLGLVSGDLDVCLPQAVLRIGESNQPSVNCDLTKGATDHDHTQP